MYNFFFIYMVFFVSMFAIKFSITLINKLISCTWFLLWLCLFIILTIWYFHVGSMASSIPSNKYWWPYLYCSVVLGFCLLVCLVGGAMFARTSVFILLVRSFNNYINLMISYPVCNWYMQIHTCTPVVSHHIKCHSNIKKIVIDMLFK